MTAEDARGEVVLGCEDLDRTLDFYTNELGLEVEMILPADAPRVAVVSGCGLRLRLEIGLPNLPLRIRLACPGVQEGREVTAPNGVIFEFVDADLPVAMPPHQQQLAIAHAGNADAWVKGRVGMRYRDLIPPELGGRYGASHIHVQPSGPLKDYVHFHKLHFQIIYCWKGWVRVVYEGQGESFVMKPGDCVLQPPGIRHRVLESSGDLHVVELSSPSGHETRADKTLELPDSTRPDSDREYGGQIFARHIADSATWLAAEWAGWESRDLGTHEASRGAVEVQVVRADRAVGRTAIEHDADLCFLYVLEGVLALSNSHGQENQLQAGDAAVVPSGESYLLDRVDPSSQLLVVRARID